MRLDRPTPGTARHGRAVLRSRVLALVLAPALIASLGAAPVAGWSNGPGVDGYGTHDWVVDQALRVLDGRADDWFDRSVALLATDDPDAQVLDDPYYGIEHVYRDNKRPGGAIHRITELYASAVRLYRAGANARLAGDSATARTTFTAASKQIGLLAHFWGDILQPYHTAAAGTGLDASHLRYERLVDGHTRSPDDAPTWSSPKRTVSRLTNVRASAIAAAAYSRSKFAGLYAEFRKDETVLSTPVRVITRDLLFRAADDLANVIWSVSQGAGVAPDVARLAVSMRWTGTKQHETEQRLYLKAIDVNGKPVEGVQVDLDWPLADGGTTHLRFFTGPGGEGHYTGSVGASPLMQKRTVAVRATTDGTTVGATTWFYTTKKLGDSTAGLRSRVNDRTVVAGQKVKVATWAFDTAGKPIAGLRIEWKWDYNGRIITTSGYTDANGRAATSRIISVNTTFKRVYVKSITSAYSTWRGTGTYFYRVDD